MAPLPLDGIRIIEPGQLLAVPYLSKMLADMGAQVIKVETHIRMDTHRNTIYPDNNPGEGPWWERGGNWHDQSRNKLGLTLNLTTQTGRDLFRALVKVSDIVTENYTPRVMPQWGLDYASLVQIKPDLIMLSSTGYGQSGPWANHSAVGPTTEAASGLSQFTGYRGEAPVLPSFPYTDFVGAEHGLMAVLMALHHRTLTGKGQWIDLAQCQAQSALLGEKLLDYIVNGREGELMGNRHLRMAPHGVYPCQGVDAWVAIAVGSDAEWAALCRVVGRDDLMEDPRFADGLSRWKHQDDLDPLISAWTQTVDHQTAMHRLQEAGLAAGAVLTNKELLLDPHLKARGYFEVNRHAAITGIEPKPYPSRPWKLSKVQLPPNRPAPTLGQHNGYVLGEILGMTEGELAELERAGVIGTVPTADRKPQPVPLDVLKRQGRITEYDPDYRQILGLNHDE